MAVDKEAVVPIKNRGLLTLEEVFQLPELPKVVTLQGEMEVKKKPIHRSLGTVIHTQQGRDLKAATTQKFLIIPATGLARWTAGANLRPGDVMVVQFETKAWNTSKTPTETEIAYAALYGALATSEDRGEWHTLFTTTSLQRRQVQEWAQKSIGVTILEENTKWANFTGLLSIKKEHVHLITTAKSHEYLTKIRTASKQEQKAWLNAVSTTKGFWTGDDFEIEVDSEEVAKTFKILSENFGIRTNKYQTLNVFGIGRFKVSLWSREDQQKAEKRIWGEQLPRTWKKRYLRDEDELPQEAKLTFLESRNLLEKRGQKFDDVEIEDLSRENAVAVINRVRGLAKGKNELRVLDTLEILSHRKVTFDIVVGTEKHPEQEWYSLDTPIGTLGASQGVITSGY